MAEPPVEVAEEIGTMTTGRQFNWLKYEFQRVSLTGRREGEGEGERGREREVRRDGEGEGGDRVERGERGERSFNSCIRSFHARAQHASGTKDTRGR